MKNSYILPIFLSAFALGSCVEDYDTSVVVEKPESVAEAEHLASLDVLNSYVDRTANPNFKLGLAVNSADYVGQGLTYSIAKTNFDVVTDAAALTYGSTVADDGTIAFTPFTDMILDGAPAVVGGPMISYNTVNTTQLQSVIADNFVKGDYEAGKLIVADFQADELGKEYAMSNGSVATVVEDPKDPEEKVLRVGSPDSKARNSYPVINVSLPDGLTLGNCRTVIFDIYCEDTNSQKKALVMILNGQRKNFTGDTPDKRGCPLQDWGRKLIQLDVAAVDKLTDADRALSEFTLSIGPNVVNTYYYIDNVTIEWERGEKDKYVEKTPEEKSTALADNFSTWATALMTEAAPAVTDYVVVSNPMSDDDAFMLRNLENETELGHDTANSFFFNDYMGDNYVATITSALSSAYAANGGNGTPHFYVSESGLLGNPGKTARLLQQIALWEAAGAKIDGIAIDLPLSYSTSASEQNVNKQDVTDLFNAVKASGKLIRLDNVSMANADADFYSFVVSQYFTLIPGDKRGGIIFAGTGDLWKNNARTPVYEAVANGMK